MPRLHLYLRATPRLGLGVLQRLARHFGELIGIHDTRSLHPAFQQRIRDLPTRRSFSEAQPYVTGDEPNRLTERRIVQKLRLQAVWLCSAKSTTIWHKMKLIEGASGLPPDKSRIGLFPQPKPLSTS